MFSISAFRKDHHTEVNKWTEQSKTLELINSEERGEGGTSIVWTIKIRLVRKFVIVNVWDKREIWFVEIVTVNYFI